MLKRLIVLLICLILLISSLILFIKPSFSSYFKDEYINVCINNAYYDLPLGSSFKDLLIALDYDLEDSYPLSLDYILKDGEVINLNSDDNLISLNNATYDELISLPGIGEKTANKIIEYRDLYGGFKYLEELKNISGIGDKKYEKIKEYITI